jgi:hypothetical protein
MPMHGSPDHDLPHPVQTPYLLTMLRRLVNYQVSIGALLEMGLLGALPAGGRRDGRRRAR